MAALEGLAEWLQGALDRRGLSPADFARMTRYSEAHVSRLLSGDRKGRDPATQERLAHALGYSLSAMREAVSSMTWPDPDEPQQDVVASIMRDPLLRPDEREALAQLYTVMVRPRRR